MERWLFSLDEPGTAVRGERKNGDRWAERLVVQCQAVKARMLSEGLKDMVSMKKELHEVDSTNHF